ncbi:MAG: type II toxin-antitoxin system Phd/YefM family antitoxin [Limosilactobacillus sp.]|nr:type II toxin-antitoxin system Phd/YefM family antitoxin [Limosilactobacillus sp.]
MMTKLITQAEFKANFPTYLSNVNNQQEIITVECPHHQSATILSTEQFKLMLTALQDDPSSLTAAIARDQLIRQGVLPDDLPLEISDNYWNQFK